jgi:hypothetical protein
MRFIAAARGLFSGADTSISASTSAPVCGRGLLSAGIILAPVPWLWRPDSQRAGILPDAAEQPVSESREPQMSGILCLRKRVDRRTGAGAFRQCRPAKHCQTEGAATQIHREAPLDMLQSVLQNCRSR